MRTPITLQPVAACETPRAYHSFADVYEAPSRKDHAKATMMRKAGIVAMSHASFRDPAEQVSGDVSRNKEVQRVARQLQKIGQTLMAQGVSVGGVAAPQIGESIAMFWLNHGFGDKGVIMVNPTSEHIGNQKLAYAHGCLSLVGPFGAPLYPARIQASWADMQSGGTNNQELHGVTAYAFRHEHDHLQRRPDGNGTSIFFADRTLEQGEQLLMVHEDHVEQFRDAVRADNLKNWPIRYPTEQWQAAVRGQFDVLDYKPA